MKKSSLFTLMIFIMACIVTLNTISANDKGKAAVVTFSKDIAPIFNAKCVECHRPGEAAPFSTLTYKDARPWAKSIKEKVVSREMPPWRADPHFGEWANDRRLSEAEIKTIVAFRMARRISCSSSPGKKFFPGL
jgi:mono/diheme cytochrome c family protein